MNEAAEYASPASYPAAPRQSRVQHWLGLIRQTVDVAFSMVWLIESHQNYRNSRKGNV